MKKKIILLSVVLIVLAGGVGIYIKSQSTNEVITPVTEVQPTLSPKVEMATWKDQAEFEFQYPKDLAVNPHDEDEVNYSHVELTSATHSGGLIVWTKDTNSTDIESWAKQSKVLNPLDTSLGEQPAKKTLGTKKLTNSTVYNGYLYQIETNLEDATYWNKVYDTVSSTFKFTSGGKEAVKETVSDDTNTPDTSVDTGSGDEEVIE